MATGGMAELLLASQQGLAGFEKLVVIKRILPHLREDKRFVQMFLDEARLAAHLKHPCIAEIYDVRRDEDSYSVVMEYLSGEDLGYVLRAAAKAETRMPIPFACRVMADVADGLHAAHSATDVDGTSHGVIHRDVSPSNIVITYDGITKLVDFGIAKANENHIYTRPGTIRGKLPYMSPEQVQAKDLDGRSDLFSLGTVFHEVLTSRRLFSGPSESAILKNVMERRIPPPSVYNPRVPAALDEIVLGLLERDPARRIGSAAELRDRLETFIHAEGVTQRRVGEWMRGALAGRHEKRRAIERQIVEEARKSTKPTPPDAELPPLFADDNVEPAVGRDPHVASSSVANAGSVSSTYQRAGSGGTPSHERVVAAPTPAHVAGTSGQMSTVTGTTSPAPRRSHGPWIALGIGVGIAVLGGVGMYVFANRGGQTREASAPVAPATAPAAGAAALAPAPAPVAPSIDTVGMLVHVMPEQATLEIDGHAAPQQVGPDGLLVPVPKGADVKVKITKDGYATHEVTLHTPQAGTMPIYVNLVRAGSAASAPVVEIKPATTASAAGKKKDAKTSTLVVAFEPANATVLLDGKAYPGASPLRADLSKGSHSVTVNAPGFESVAKTFDLAPGATYEMNVHLSRAAIVVGRVDFRSTPMGAVVSLNGEVKGRTPILGLELPVGKAYAVAVTLDGYEAYTTTVSPTAERAISLDAVMSAKPKAPAAAVAKAPSATPAPSAPPPPAAASAVAAQAKPTAPPAAATNTPKPVPAAAKVAAEPRQTGRVVPASTVTKLSGNAPTIDASRVAGQANINAKLCIDEQGNVTSARVPSKLPDDVKAELQRSFSAWHYMPYMDRGSNIAMAVCFAVQVTPRAGK
jgi:eukaryotic-like serine/threonine-protein kinase